MTTITTDLQHALTETEEALAEHDRLRTLERSLAADLVAAKVECEQAAAARDSAEADTILAASDPDTTKRLKAARSRSEEADATLARLQNAQRALPTKLVETDMRITTTAAALELAAAPARMATIEAYSSELQAALKALGVVLTKGHALAAAGAGLSRHLEEMLIPNPLGGPPLLQGAYLTTGSEVVNLREAWRDNAQAASLHAQIAPLHRVQLRLRPHMARIEQDRSVRGTRRTRRTTENHSARTTMSVRRGRPKHRRRKTSTRSFRQSIASWARPLRRRATGCTPH